MMSAPFLSQPHLTQYLYTQSPSRSKITALPAVSQPFLEQLLYGLRSRRESEALWKTRIPQLIVLVVNCNTNLAKTRLVASSRAGQREFSQGLR